MKLLIASDIHGSAYYCKKLLKAAELENSERILLLGDLLYHGPRNDLPMDYNPKTVIEMLNNYKNRIFCVRGNCEAEVDQMVLEFPVMADYSIVYINNRIIYATHGHIYNESNPPKLQSGDILLNGHTHIPKCVKHDNYLYINPGSTSIPKEGTPNSYIVFNENEFIWKNLNSGESFMSHLI